MESDGFVGQLILVILLTVASKSSRFGHFSNFK